MNKDITYCSNENCPIKEHCVRFDKPTHQLNYIQEFQFKPAELCDEVASCDHLIRKASSH